MTQPEFNNEVSKKIRKEKSVKNQSINGPYLWRLHIYGKLEQSQHVEYYLKFIHNT